jgi:adenine phosphoribosyltransferase
MNAEIMTMEQISRLIRDVADFPKKGILFKDITPVLENAEAFQSLAKNLAARVSPQTDKLVAIESRGFILGAAVAQHCGCGLVLVRKPGKLPRETLRETYALEYGTDSLEIHRDALKAGDRVTLIDDVLATGGTAAAVEKLCANLGAQVLGSLFMMEIDFLKGRTKLSNPLVSLLNV